MDPYKAFLLETQIRSIDETLAKLQLELEELREALKWIQELHPKSAYRIFGGRVAIEVEPEKLKKVIEDEIKLLEAKIETLKKERDRLEAELKSVR